ncbi:MAG: hypothetical protein M0Z53_02990 [Thermaerobacter sp.]|nr:hypothetical protein [Thermaerobacter sp.]
MASRLNFFVAVLRTCGADLGDSHDAIRVSDDVPAQIRLAESRAKATWRTLQCQGVDFPPSTRAVFLASPFAGSEVPVIVIDGATVVYNEIWPNAGSLKDREIALETLAAVLRADAAVCPPGQKGQRRAAR